MLVQLGSLVAVLVFNIAYGILPSTYKNGEYPRKRMRNLYQRDAGGSSADQKRGGNPNLIVHPLHAKYKGIISTAGYCKFSAWKRELELPRTTFSTFIMNSLNSQDKNKIWLKDISTGRTETFKDAVQNVDKLKKGLAKLGVGVSTVVCMCATNYIEYCLICLAVWELGAAIMPVNCLIHPNKLSRQLRSTSCKVLVCDEFNLEEALEVKTKVECVETVILMAQDPYAESDHGQGVVTIKELVECVHQTTGHVRHGGWDTQPIYLVWTGQDDDQAVVQHTSKSLIAQMFSPGGTSNHWFDQNQSSVILSGCWFFHTIGLYSFALSAVHGTSLYVLSEYSDENLLQGLSDSSITSVILYPWQMRMLTQSSTVEKYDLSHLRLIMTGGSLLGPQVRQDILDKNPNIRYIREAYGTKETGFLTLNYPKDRTKQMIKVDVADDHLMPVGLPNMWSVFKIIDRVSGQPVTGSDLQGELCVKTCQLMVGYKDKDESFLDSEGYFHTGDLGYYDKDGVIHFIEKISNLIHFWMYEVSPSVLESRLLAHTSVIDAAVIAISDKADHEETEENLTNFLESRLQDHERLRGGLYYIQHIPRDENWRVERSVLEQYIPQVEVSDADASEAVENTDVEATTSGDVVKNDDNNDAITVTAATPSPRTLRAAEVAAAIMNPLDKSLQNQEPQDVFGMRSRSRRGSRDDLLDSPRSNDYEKIRQDQSENSRPGEEIQYSVKVQVSTSFLERELLEHPGVEDVAVRGVTVHNIGKPPRAYVVQKEGFQITAEEFITWSNSRLSWHYRLYGVVMLTDRLARTGDGLLLANLDRLDSNLVLNPDTSLQ